MIFCTDTHFIHESSNEFLTNLIFFTKSLILPTITNKSAHNSIKTIRTSYQQGSVLSILTLILEFCKIPTTP